MFNKLMEMFRTPSAEVLALKELEEAERSLLEAQTSQEYSKRMAEYHNDRIKRLTAYLHLGVAK
jgi:hypothetical protein